MQFESHWSEIYLFYGYIISSSIFVITLLRLPGYTVYFFICFSIWSNVCLYPKCSQVDIVRDVQSFILEENERLTCLCLSVCFDGGGGRVDAETGCCVCQEINIFWMAARRRYFFTFLHSVGHYWVCSVSEVISYENGQTMHGSAGTVPSATNEIVSICDMS